MYDVYVILKYITVTLTSLDLSPPSGQQRDGIMLRSERVLTLGPGCCLSDECTDKGFNEAWEVDHFFRFPDVNRYWLRVVTPASIQPRGRPTLELDDSTLTVGRYSQCVAHFPCLGCRAVSLL